MTRRLHVDQVAYTDDACAPARTLPVDDGEHVSGAVHRALATDTAAAPHAAVQGAL